MISFMLIGLPRSGTTWAANWFCTERTHCLHDPLWKYHYSELDDIPSSKALGVSCTGLWCFPDWVNAHPAQKVILHRDLGEINESLALLGMPPYDGKCLELLRAIRGKHVPHTDLWEKPAALWEYLIGTPFNEERHRELSAFSIQPAFEKIVPDKAATKRLVQEVLAMRSV